MSKTIDRIRSMPHVRYAYLDSDGYWIGYVDGYVSPRSALTSDHEETAREALSAAREAMPMARPAGIPKQ
jgi:hypothetical protein